MTSNLQTGIGSADRENLHQCSISACATTIPTNGIGYADREDLHQCSISLWAAPKNFWYL
jgi:hypothetical protein